jgi:hypothetical protein
MLAMMVMMVVMPALYTCLPSGLDVCRKNELCATHPSTLIPKTQHHTTVCTLPCLQVSFLANMVGPKIAAAAAQRALEVLAEEDAAAAEAVAAQAAQAHGGAGVEANGAPVKQEGGGASGSDAVRAVWKQLVGWSD